MKPIAKVYTAIIFLFLFAPIAILLVFSFNSGNSLSVFSGFSLYWYKELFQDSNTLEALRNTLVLALCAAILSTVLGTAASVGMNKLRSKYMRAAMNTVTNLPMVNPEIITGISLMLLFVAYQRFAGGLDFLPDNIMGLPTLLIAHIAFNVPYVIFNVTPKLKQLDIKLYEAALDLGCDPKQAFFKVILPEISPAILSAFLICLTYSIDDFMISYFNCGTVETLPIAIYSMTRKKVSPEIYALSTIMFVVILSIILISNAMESREYRKDQRALRGGDAV